MVVVMSATPAYLKDAKDVLTAQGFITSNVWYHGTSSELLESIQANGLKRSGDKAITESLKKTMATIQHEFEVPVEPVFLTPSKELAYYWAEQKVRERKLRLGGNDEPVVLAVTLPDAENAKVKPDVGAASLLLLEEGEHFMVQLAKIYQENNAGVPEIDLRQAERMEYLTVMGMAYLDDDIDAAAVQLLQA